MLALNSTSRVIIRTALALLLCLGAMTTAQAEDEDTIKLGYAKCAHCTSMSLTPENATGVKLEAIPFNTGNDVLTALLSKSIDIAQVTYLHYATALDKGFEVVAISGQVSGGSQILIANALPVQAGDWEGLVKLIRQYKAEGKPFRVAASRGNAQDIQMRGAFLRHGIDINKDVQFVNIPNPADHTQALRRGEMELVTSVEPFATQIRDVKAAKFFDYPYDQAAGKLTNLIITRPDVIKAHPQGVLETVRAIVKVNGLISDNKALFADTIQKVTGLDATIARGAVDNLYPDYKMHRASAIAIAQMMRQLKYINGDVSDAVEKNMDYQFLEAVTGKPKTELGF
ncbi:ABC-type nitrate/sulfonate/bicarbonate transport system substrate-binding protein [Gibbsiella quercinecans]|uniref:ABC transporter substrate-binding protein n=1 Tax=Gibbsiella quercinecans TaxID=929813 RepID=A0A250AW74_9GAMM|nr:ABC transporter substrate-binding protein [Gibbsiella quercinecans]ATA18187.1 ABC transporter substrate-binding protein [Gibbsiella quercinecans]RLM06756.1 ABC transporter substrate-binding protein [Gibbsiella quercinecans]RLM12912.1 ABC transporter substrate-binding protein [Gibbsiella quercinecans]TCT92525.1 ABC-type nitrate/sulfonate/bicarbonate transport system substrate-binding protein [Gibbsiella quercinecans]